MKRRCGNPRARGSLTSLVAAITVLILGGCGTLMRSGRPLDPAQLDTLSKGTSTKIDVLKAVGAPNGTGRALFPHEKRPREVWSYWYEESTSSDSQRIFLFVFFDDMLYTGSMWFSSLPQFHSGPHTPPPPAAP